MMHFTMDYLTRRTGCDLYPYDLEARGEYVVVIERVDCAGCNAAIAAADRRRALDDFFRLDLEHDLDDGDHRPWFWREKQHRERID